MTDIDPLCLCGHPAASCAHAASFVDHGETAWQAYRDTIGVTVSGRPIWITSNGTRAAQAARQSQKDGQRSGDAPWHWAAIGIHLTREEAA